MQPFATSAASISWISQAGRPIHQVPVLLWTASGIDMTHNPVWIEPHATGLRAYFIPEDDASSLYIYDVETS